MTTLAEPTRTCAIPRNDAAIQPFQPSHNMVEWAVDARTCTIDQSTDGAARWRYLDNAVLKRGARVLLKNVDPNGQGNVDIAFDAVAFVPISGAGHPCGQVY